MDEAGGEEGGLPTGAGALGRRVSERERSGGGCGGRNGAGPEEGPHGILSGCIRRGVLHHWLRLSGSEATQAAQARQSPQLHRCTSRDHADDARRAWPGPGLCPSGEEGDSSPARTGAFCRDRDPLVPRAQRDPWEGGRGWMAKQAASEPDDRGVEWLTLAI